MKNDFYLPRLVDTTLREYLSEFPAVLITGPKWCGKSTTARRHAKSTLYFGGDDGDGGRMSRKSLRSLLEGETPRLIDEWQVAPSIYDLVKERADLTGERGMFILTGSRSPKKGSTSHTGFMRIVQLRMSTMSLFESGESSGEVSLLSLFSDPEGISGNSPIDRDGIRKALVRGGYPALVENPGLSPSRQLDGMVDAICETELSEAMDVRADPSTAFALLRSLSRNDMSTGANRTILSDMSYSGHPISEATFYRYLDGLRKLFLIDEIPAFSPLVRSRKAIRTSPKRFFVDPSIPVAVLRRSEDYFLSDGNTFGILFENLVARDLSIYSRLDDLSLSHFRKDDDLEVDFILSKRSGEYIAIEAKSSSFGIEKAKDGLLRFKSSMESLARRKGVDERIAVPSALVVVTDSGRAYTLEDGVHVVPVSSLRP